MKVSINQIQNTIWSMVKIEIPLSKAKFQDLKNNGWAPKQVGSTVIVAHKTHRPHSFVNMISTNFVA
jgi:hypothetical protein